MTSLFRVYGLEFRVFIVYLVMALKKIIHNAFEEIAEAGKDMAKSSAKQIEDTLSPWEMIRNSFDTKEGANQESDQMNKIKEMQGKGDKHTPLNFNKLQDSYANQDKQKINAMKQRLFQLVKRDEEKQVMKGKQEKAQKEQAVTHEEMEKRRRIEEKKRQDAMSAAPEGKSGRGTALSGKKKRKATEPQPAETKPGSSKQ